MHFQISLSLWELQVIKDLLCVRDIAGISSNRLLLLLILKKKKSNFTWNQLCWSLLFNKVAWLRACNVFAKTVNSFRYGSKYVSEPHLVFTITIQMYIKIQMILEAVVQRCSVKKVFFEISQNSHSGQQLYFKKWLWYRSFPVNFVKFLKTLFFIGHIWWLFL